MASLACVVQGVVHLGYAAVLDVHSGQPGGPVPWHFVHGSPKDPCQTHGRGVLVKVVRDDLEHVILCGRFWEADGDGVHGHSTHDGTQLAWENQHEI